jgi:hypothetical protein
VVAREMPPWSADPRHGTFSNDPRLSELEIDTIARWVDAGAPKGDLAQLPPLPKFAEGWTIGEPDAVFTMQEEYKVPAEGTVPYLYFRIPTNLKEDRWVQAYEVRPGNRSVVHHVIANAQPGGGNLQDERTPGRVGLGGVTPNKPGVVLPKGVARLLKAGSEIVFQMHYTTNGQETTDRTSIGLIFAKEPPQKMSRGNNILNAGFLIPAGVANHEVRASRTFNEDTLLTDLTPHMHMRGKDMIYTAFYPDGPLRDPAGSAEVGLQLAAHLPAGGAQAAAEGHQARGGRALRQLQRQPVQPRPRQGRALGRPDVGRDDDRLLHDAPRSERRRAGPHELRSLVPLPSFF